MSLTPFTLVSLMRSVLRTKGNVTLVGASFEEREAIAKLDPLHWHKYTRRVISEGFEPEEPEL